MTDVVDWDEIRRHKFATVETPPEWPRDVHAVSFNGISLLGIDNGNNLYWDGKRLQHVTRLGRVERGLAWAVAGATIATAIFEGLGVWLAWYGAK